MFELSIRGEFSSAHLLKGHKGKCKNLHGHAWKVDVIIISDHLDEIGMVVDFAVLKKEVNTFLESLDHVCLNDLDAFKETNPTTENIAKYIYGHLKKTLQPLTVKKVRVWESDTSSVVYYE